MKIKFKKSAPGFAYFTNDIGDIEPESAARLVDEGYAIIVPETEGDDNELPEDLPGRSILYKEGIKTIEDVNKIIDSLTEIKGIGKKLAAEIFEFINAPA
jgi:predicted flap endonuclease-1-like 5' DNA nuclease